MEESHNTNSAMAVSPYEAFEILDLRVGRILRAEPNVKARKPAYRLWIDFGDMGERTSSAQITELYTPQELEGRLIIAAVTLGTRLVAGFKSEVLVMGVNDAEGRVILLAVEREAQPGSRVY